VVSYRYDPYGKVAITRGGTPQSSDPLGNHWTFTGRSIDEESGLLYYRGRHYDPSLGRFVEKDPLGAGAGPTLYTYVGNRPTALIDPSGLLEVRPDGKPPTHRGVIIKLDGIVVAGGNWTWDDAKHWREEYLDDLLTNHEYVHAASMGEAYADSGQGGQDITVTGEGEAGTKKAAMEAAKADAEAKLRYKLEVIRDDLYAPEFAKDDRHAMPAYAVLPDYAYGSPGVSSSWRDERKVVDAWTADNARRRLMGKEPAKNPPQAWTSIEFRGMEMTEKYACEQRWFMCQFVGINGGGVITAVSRRQPYWHCRCWLTGKLPYQVTAVVTYPVPNVRMVD
jgi:RHS repeat-associated protein